MVVQPHYAAPLNCDCLGCRTSTNSNYYKRQSVLGVLKSALRNVAKMQSAAGQAGLKSEPIMCANVCGRAHTLRTE